MVRSRNSWMSFLSTPSARRATVFGILCKHVRVISIHALREEGDTSAMRSRAHTSHFYPRPPRGGRLYALDEIKAETLFLSTPSARRATSSWGCIVDAAEFLSTPSARRATDL